MNLPWPFCRKRSATGHPRSRQTGDWGEQLAADLLKRQGYRILGRNVRFGSRCELDIVARSPAPDTLVFVEVKTRRNELFGRPADAVDRAKRRAIGRAAQRYLRRLPARPDRVRFDVVEVIGSPDDNQEPRLRHIERAFSLGPAFRLPE